MTRALDTALAESIPPRNYILNPTILSDQASVGTVAITSTYFCDGWLAYMNLAGGAATVGRVLGVVNPSGSESRGRITVTTGKTLAAGEYLIFATKIEGINWRTFQYGTATAKSCTVRFGFKGPAGTYSVCFRNAPATRGYAAMFTITPGQANTDTTQTFIIPGETTGTWDTVTGTGIEMMVTLAAASGSLITPGAWAATASALGGTGQTGVVANGAVFEIFDVGLYAGLNAPVFEIPDYIDELARLQRYYYSGFCTMGNYHVAGNAIRLVRAHPVQMRASPTVTFGTPTYSNASSLAVYSSGSMEIITSIIVTGTGGAAVDYTYVANARL